MEKMLGVKTINVENKDGIVDAWFMGDLRLGGYTPETGDPARYLYREVRSSYVVIYKITSFVTFPKIRMNGMTKFYAELEIVQHVSNESYTGWLKEFTMHPYV